MERMCSDMKTVVFGLTVALCLALTSLAFLSKPSIVQSQIQLVVPDGVDVNTELILIRQLDQYKQALQDSYESAVTALNTKINAMLALLGIAVSVWVGLNIYNYIERQELEKMRAELVESFRRELSGQIETAKAELDIKIQAARKYQA